MSYFLLEIGTEEIPAGFLPKARQDLKSLAESLLKEKNIDFQTVQAYTTPRRLALIVENIAKQQKDSVVIATGPPLKAAYDSDGKLTKASIGFARSKGVEPESLFITDTEKGRYITARIEQKGAPTPKALSDALPALLNSLHFPKSMRWGAGSMRFARPIHRIAALFDNQSLQFSIENLASSDQIQGHRFLSPALFKLNQPQDYVDELKARHVIVNPDERKQSIVRQLNEIAESLNCAALHDDDLLETVTFLVEYPVAVAGQFHPQYLELPRELLIISMKSHQKFFSLVDRSNQLTSCFIVVSDTIPENADTVRAGAERALKARLEDARFYFEEDRQIPLAHRLESLKSVMFQEKLGSLYEKVSVLSKLAESIAHTVNPSLIDDARQAARLSKADLVTGVIREFPELQGYMGRIYAQASGENQSVAVAIEEHYLPKFSGDKTPATDCGAIVSLADKIDNIVAFFAIGLIPSGSEDPFALRRQAIGVIQILLDKGYPLTIHGLITLAIQTRQDKLPIRETLYQETRDFLDQRLEAALLANSHPYDSVKSMLPSGNKTVADILQRLDTLTGLREKPNFQDLLIAAKRVYNILKHGAQNRPLSRQLFQKDAEGALAHTAADIETAIDLRNDFTKLFNFIAPINLFFEEVLVMDKDMDIQTNRLALLERVKSVFDRLCDFSKLVETSAL